MVEVKTGAKFIVTEPMSSNAESDTFSDCESATSSKYSDPDDAPVYVSYEDFQTLKRNMEAFKASCKIKTLGSDGDSLRASSEEKSVVELHPVPRKSELPNDHMPCSSTSTASNPKYIAEDARMVPTYKVHCCNKAFSSPSALFSHLRVSHKVGTDPDMSLRCKLCSNFVNEDMQMLHIELLHTVSRVRTYEIRFGEYGNDNATARKKSYCRTLELVPYRGT